MKTSSIPLYTLILLASLAISACSEATDNDATACPDIRLQMCTQQYTPVCALTTAGDHKTYSNACAACVDQRVISHKKDACN